MLAEDSGLVYDINYNDDDGGDDDSTNDQY